MQITRDDFVKLIAIPAIVSVVGFIIGFFVKDVGVIKAKEQALTEFKMQLDPIRSEMNSVLQKARNIESESQVALRLANMNLSEVERVNKVIGSYISIQEAGEIVDSATKKLKQDPGFISLVTESWPKGKYCVLANTCPSYTIDKGTGGYIQPKSEQCAAGTDGAAINDDWRWCHPRVCCK